MQIPAYPFQITNSEELRKSYHKPDNLVIDTLKGMLIMMLTRRTSWKVTPVAERHRCIENYEGEKT